MARVVVLALVSSVAASLLEVFDNRTLSMEYHRRLAMIPHGKTREMGAVAWKVGRLGRRLTEGSSDDGSDDDFSLSDECETACKEKFDPFEADVKEIEKATEDLDDEKKLEHMGNMMGCMFQAMCKHKGAFTCLAETDACKDDIKEEEGKDSGGTSLASLNGMMTCLCDDCPEMIQGMAGVMQAAMDMMMAALEAMGGGNSTLTEEEMVKDLLKATCPLVPAIECAEEKDSCSTDDESMTSVLEAFKESEGDTQEDEVAEMKKQCEAEDIKMTLPETAKYTCDNIPGLDIDVDADGAALTAAGVVSLAAVALASLH